MSGPFTIRIVRTAAQAITEAAEWWVSNRPKAPHALAEELERAFQLIASQPALVLTPGTLSLQECDAFTSRGSLLPLLSCRGFAARN